MSSSFSPNSSSRIATGTRLNGIYEIDSPIGSGGMGEIYKGHTIQTGDLVAIKLMLPELAENEAAMALFRKEASALHSIHHEAIVRYYVFTIEPILQRPYLAMEFVEGQSLSELLKRGPLTFDAMYALKHRLATGLQAAHERGVIHRDVSPDNIIIPSGDVSRAKIIDFGIARSTRMNEATVIGSGFAGKFNYVSPEQLGLFGGNVTGRSDIYSLGLLLAETLTGQPIDMAGSQLDVIEKRRRVPDLGAIDLRVRPLIEKMLQPDPANRPESMATVAAWQVGAARPIEISHSRETRRDYRGTAEQAPRKGGRGKIAAIAAGVAVILLSGGGTAYYFLSQPDIAVAPAPPALKPLASVTGPPSEILRPAPDLPSALRPEPSLTAPSLSSPSTSPRPPAVTPPLVAPDPLRPNAVPQLTPALPPSRLDVTTPAAPRIESPNQVPHLTMLPPSPGLTPGTVPPLTLQPPAALGPTDKISRYISEYQGGDCFFIAPVTVSANTAKIEGYGASLSPFNTLDTAFKRANGFEADIGVRQVTTAQCPAITFLRRIRGERGQALRLQIGETALASGQALTGTVGGYGNRQVELLLVSDEGSVVNVSSLLKPAAEGKTFNLRMQRTGAAGPQPQLLIAVATSKPLETLRPRGAVEADLFFPLVAGEASRVGETLAAATRYFKLDR